MSDQLPGTIEAVSTWGHGADVLVSVRVPVLLMEAPGMLLRLQHGIVNHAQFDLTCAEAEALANGLLAAAKRSRELDEGYDDYCKKEAQDHAAARNHVC